VAGQQLLEDVQTGRPVALEEGRLRFDRRDLVPEGGEHRAAEGAQPLRIVGQAPRLQQGGMRVDARHHRTVPGCGPLQAAPERLGAHAEAPVRERSCARRRVWACRLVTANGSTGSASIAWTAAWNSCRVVMIGTSMLVAAARMAYPSARASDPEGVFSTRETSPASTRSITLAPSPGSEALRSTRQGMPERRRTLPVPAVVRISKPRAARRATGSTTARLSLSATETNTVPEVGSPCPATASCDFAKASGKVASSPITSPVERIS